MIYFLIPLPRSDFCIKVNRLFVLAKEKEKKEECTCREEISQEKRSPIHSIKASRMAGSPKNLVFALYIVLFRKVSMSSLKSQSCFLRPTHYGLIRFPVAVATVAHNHYSCEAAQVFLQLN